MTSRRHVHLGLLRIERATHSKASGAKPIGANGLIQQLLELFGRHLQVTSKLRSYPRLWAAFGLTAFPSSDGRRIDTQLLGKPLLSEAHRFPSLSEAVPLGRHPLPSLIHFDPYLPRSTASTRGCCLVAAGEAPCIQPATSDCVQGTTETGLTATKVKGA